MVGTFNSFQRKTTTPRTEGSHQAILSAVAGGKSRGQFAGLCELVNIVFKSKENDPFIGFYR